MAFLVVGACALGVKLIMHVESVNDVDGVYVEVHIDCWLDVGHQQIWRG